MSAGVAMELDEVVKKRIKDGWSKDYRDEAAGHWKTHWPKFSPHLKKKVRDLGDPALIDACCDFTTPLEGFIPHLYCDSVGLVTVGKGSMIDGDNSSRRSGFTFTLGARAATTAEVDADFKRCKDLFKEAKTAFEEEKSKATEAAAKEMKFNPPVAGKYEDATSSVRITLAQADTAARKDVEEAIESLKGSSDGWLGKHKALFDDYPALVGIVLVDMVYNLGAGGLNDKFPKFNQSVIDGRWEDAAKQSFSNVGAARLAMRYMLLLACSDAPAAKASEADALAPPKGQRFGLRLDLFWKEVATYGEWDYQYDHDHHHKWTDTAPGYPDSLVGSGKLLSYCAKNSSATKNLAGDNLGRFYTNCCMFVEAAVMGIVQQMSWAGEFKWPIEMHNTVMVAPGGHSYPAVHAYVEAGIATALPDVSTLELEPKTIYIAMTGGHQFFIVDYDKGTRKFLTLEANHWPEFKRVDWKNWWGGVGFGGVGRVEDQKVLEDGRPKGWSAGKDVPVWNKGKPKLRGTPITHVVRLNVEAPSGVHLPFDPPTGARSPWPRCYFVNEALGEGGYFPLGEARNLHSGVHLPLETKPDAPPAPQPVHALGPGEIVAARLGRPKAGSSNELSLALARNHNGFVLVRHRLRLGGKAEPDAPVVAVYALYMHLAPLAEDPALDAQLPWLEQLKRQRHGALIEVDPALKTFLSRHWLFDDERPVGTIAEQTKVKVFGEAPATSVDVELKSEAGRIAAVRRAADADVGEALAALEDDGQVATFALPFLPVAAGELLGHVAPVPTKKEGGVPGFLHWEVLSPVVDGRSDLHDLLTHAEARLALGDGFFPLLQELTPNNLLDAGSGELAALLGLLPDADDKALLTDAYAAKDLKALMSEQPTKLDFAGGTTRSEKLDYPVAIELENYQHEGKATIKAGTKLTLQVETDTKEKLPVELTFDDKVAKGVVHVPAGARILSVTQPGGVLTLDQDVTRKTLAEVQALEVEQLKRIASARWRHVRLRRPNEWTVEGLTRVLGARFPGAQDALRKFAEAIAWWGHAANENPIVGVGKDESSLFDGGAGRLPAANESTLDSVNPITLAWVLDLLLERRHVSFVPLAELGDARRPAYLGWVQGKEKNELWAVAIARGEVSGGPAVELRARSGERSIPLGATTWLQGAAAVKVGSPLWGTWKLDVSGAAPATPPEALGTLDFEAPRPVLASDDPVKGPEWRAKDHGYEWTIDFAQHRPEQLRGWVLLETQRGALADDGWKLEKLGIPLHLRVPTAAAGGAKLVDGFYVSGDAKAQVSASYTYGDYCKAAGAKTCKVSARLVRVVQAIQDRTKVPLRLTKLDPGGLFVSLGVPRSLHPELEAELPRSKGVTTQLVAAEDRLQVTVEPPAGESGALVGTFTPHAALKRLVEQHALPAGERLHVRFRALFVPGRGPANQAIEEQDWAKLRAEGGDDRLEVRGTEHRTLEAGAFGPCAGSLEKNGTLTVRAPLLGADADFWTAVKPGFVVNGKASGAADKQRTEVVTSIALAKFVKKKLSVHATCTGTSPDDVPDKAEDGASFDYDVTPAILRPVLVVDESGSSLRLTAKLQAWPPEKNVQVRVFGDTDKPLKVQPVFDSRGSSAGTGACDGQGAFGATISLQAIRDALKPGNGPYRVELRSDKASAVLGSEIPPPWRSPPQTLPVVVAEPTNTQPIAGAP